MAVKNFEKLDNYNPSVLYAEARLVYNKAIEQIVNFCKDFGTPTEDGSYEICFTQDYNDDCIPDLIYYYDNYDEVQRDIATKITSSKYGTFSVHFKRNEVPMGDIKEESYIDLLNNLVGLIDYLNDKIE